MCNKVRWLKLPRKKLPNTCPLHARQSEEVRLNPKLAESEKIETSNNQADPSINKEAESSFHEAKPKMKNLEYKTLPPPPFPNRLKNAKLDKQFNKFLDVFK